jgi:Putative beta-barrel porin-2, OmpL-like. bbp2
MRKSILLMLCSVFTFSTMAQDATEPKAKFAFSGYLDSYYFANLNKPASRNNLGASGTARAFDQRSGTFGLGLVQTKVTYTSASGKTDAVVDLSFGPNADLGQYGNVAGPLGVGSTSLAIKQAYVNWKPTSKLTLTAGQFGTHIGYEVIDAPINYNYSLSNLFNNGPFYHIGVKANVAISDKFSIMGGIVNNVDALYDNNRAKALIGQVFFTPVSGWNVYVNGITSNEATAGDDGLNVDGASYALLDLTTSYQMKKLLVGLNAAVGSQDTDGKSGKKGWSGVALYTNYAVSDKFSLGARYETFNNSEAIRGLVIPAEIDADGKETKAAQGIKMNSLTLTATFTVGDGNLLLKPEFRVDTADKNFFNGEKAVNVDALTGKVTGFDKKSQSTLGMAMIYKF